MGFNRCLIDYTINGNPVNKPPRCAGVYRFFSSDAVLLYIGKSVDITARLNSHFNEANPGSRQHRMMSAVRRIDCQLTAGDTGAQLIENVSIKAESPLYNRRQKRSRKLWTQKLTKSSAGFLQIKAADFCTSGERLESVFGLFRSRYHIDSHIRDLVRDNRLCLRMMGFEKGRGACFQHQIGRCGGACVGEESAETHNKRLLFALEAQRIAAWPFAGAIMLEEVARQPSEEGQPKRQFHLINHWSYLGTCTRRDQASRKATAPNDLAFDRDSYRITLRAMRENQCLLIDAASGEVLNNPFASVDTDNLTCLREAG